MNPNHVIVMTRSLTKLPSRRDVVRGLASAGLGLGAVRLPDIADAKKKRKHKHKHKKKVKPATPNEFGCYEVGDLCQSADDCCSGICEGKKGKLTCHAHDTGSCRQDLGTSVCQVVSIEDSIKVFCDNTMACGCFRTTSDSLYCATLFVNSDTPRCVDCKTDADCVALGFPPQAACTNVSERLCSGTCPTGMACLVPCGTELPDLPA